MYSITLRIEAEHFDGTRDPVKFDLKNWRTEAESLIDYTVPEFLLLRNIIWYPDNQVTLEFEDPRGLNPELINNLIQTNYSHPETYYDAERGIKMHLRL